MLKKFFRVLSAVLVAVALVGVPAGFSNNQVQAARVKTHTRVRNHRRTHKVRKGYSNRHIYENMNGCLAVFDSPMLLKDESFQMAGRPVKKGYFNTNMRLVDLNGRVWLRIANGKYAGKWTPAAFTKQRSIVSKRYWNNKPVKWMFFDGGNYGLSKALVQGNVYYFIVYCVK